MYDASKVIPGIIVFVLVVTFPVWYALGKTSNPPDNDAELNLLREEGKMCIEDREYMRAQHMNLLDEWRNAAVRDGQRTYISVDEELAYEISLTNTCLECHGDGKAASVGTLTESAIDELPQPDFCLSCHDYAGVEPDCFSCHLQP